MTVGAKKRPHVFSLALIVCFCVGATCSALGARDTIDRTIDWAAIAIVAGIAALIGGGIGARYAHDATVKAKVADALFGAISLAFTTFAILDWSNVKLDRSPSVSVSVTAGERVSAGRAGTQRIVVVFGKRWLLSDRLAGPCKNARELELDVSAGWLGQRWVRAVRCAESHTSDAR